MPMIIDANRAGDFGYPLSGRAENILQAIRKYRMKICVGGKLYIELSRTRIRELLVEFDRAGILIRVESDEIDDAEKSILSIGINSDDPHILALAKVSRTRLLYTEDRELMDDFQNTQVLTPKGVVITPSTPAHHTDNKLREHSP